MHISFCRTQSDWESCFLPQKSSFLQSWEWGQFQKKVGNQPLFLFLQKGEHQYRLLGLEQRFPLGMRYVYIPRAFVSKHMLSASIPFLREKGYMHIRIEPIESLEDEGLLSEKVESKQPQQTILVDLSESNEALQKNMHQKTRYNIRLAQKKGVIVRKEKNIDIFWELNEQTAQRDKFKTHPKAYYEEMLSLDMVHQLTAYAPDNTPIASNIVVTYRDTCTYLHGTSSNSYRNLMAPYLLQWEGMMLGKEKECHYYDFWGVASQGTGPQTEFHAKKWDIDHPLTGVTRFKVGFGGTFHTFGDPKNIILSPMKHKLFHFVKRIKG